MNEIAERAGVSSATVARVLLGEVREHHRRRVESSKRIRQLAGEMGDSKNPRARSFPRGRTHGIGLLYTDDTPIFEGMNTHIVNSLVRALQRAGYHLVLAPIGEGGSWEDIILEGQIDGGVVFQTLPAKVRAALRDRQLPIVLLGDNSDSKVSHIAVDDFGGAYAGTKHLLGLGQTRIMIFVHGSVKPHCSVAERVAGYRAAMTEAGLKPWECLQSPEEDVIDVLVRGPNRPTDVICYSNLEATLVVHSMWQYGVSIPNGLSVIGFNDMFATRYMTPPLTTIGFDASKIGELGAQLVLREIDGSENGSENGRSPSVLTIKPKLNVRGSTGPAP